MSLVTTIIWCIEIKVYLLSQNLIFRGVVNIQLNYDQLIYYWKVRARSDMSGHVPAESHRQAPEAGRQAPEAGRQPSRPIRSRHGALAVQSGADTEPLDTNHRWARVFFLIWEAGHSYKTCPHPSYLADSLYLLAHLPPGVLPESDRPIKAFTNCP